MFIRVCIVIYQEDAFAFVFYEVKQTKRYYNLFFQC
jgi:hypothetical protein